MPANAEDMRVSKKFLRRGIVVHTEQEGSVRFDTPEADRLAEYLTMLEDKVRKEKPTGGTARVRELREKAFKSS